MTNTRFAGMAFATVLAASANAQLKLTQIVTGLSAPVAVVQDPTQSNVMFVCQQRGRIRAVQNGVIVGTDALNLTGTVSTAGSEKGLLGLAFHPNYAQNGFVYVYYTSGNTSLSTTSWVARYTRNAINPLVFDLGSAQPVFTIAQPFQNHNGGTLAFGPDGMLYLGLGDGGDAGDPGDRAQNLTNLLGKFLRFDVSGDDFPGDPNRNYKIPAGQPFAVTGGTLGQEIWSFGWRNPWKWSFDDPTKLGTGGLAIADVGQNVWEEVDYEPPATPARNYGWRRREGYVNFTTSSGPNTEYRDPVWVYDHNVGQSITGGFIYRGVDLGDYFGRYFFADYVQSRVWSMPIPINPVTGEASNVSAGTVIEHTSDLGIGSPLTFGGVSTFTVNQNGELFVVDYGGGPSTSLGRIFRVDPDGRFVPTDLSMIQGTLMGGVLRSILSEDAHDFQVEAQYRHDSVYGDGSAFRIGHRFEGTAPSALNVTVRARTNLTAGQTCRVGLKNWITSRIDWIGSFALTSSEATFTSTTVAAANYRRASDGRYEVIVSPMYGPIQVGGVQTFVDKVMVNPASLRPPVNGGTGRSLIGPKGR